MSQAVPFLSRWLDMPRHMLPGDDDMPRYQAPDKGASERLAVSPGREDEGIFHMPGGQSGHPLSPYYGAGHDAWVEGRPTPLLPGPTEYTLTLVPTAPRKGIDE
jgi:penicillin amidase